MSRPVVWSLSIVLALAACRTMGGGIAEIAAGVTGKLVFSKSAKPATCSLEVFREGESKRFGGSSIEERFLYRFGGPAGRYYFLISCDGYQPFRSSVYRVNDMRYLTAPIDLGAVTLR